MRRIFSIIAIAFAVLVVAVAIWRVRYAAIVPQPVSRDWTRVTIGMPFIPGMMPALFAKEKGYFSEEDIDVTFVDTYPTFAQMPKDFASGKYDITEISNSVFAGSSDIYETGKVALLGYYSLEGSAIVAKKGIGSISDAPGKTIAVLPGGDFLAYWALRVHSIPIKDVHVVTGTWADLKDDIIAGKYDYAYLTSPNIERVVNQSGSKVVYYAKDDVGSVTSAFVFSDKFIAAHRDAAVRFVRAYFKGLTYAKAHPEEFRDFIVSKLNMSPVEADAYILSGAHLLDARENLQSLTPGFGIKNFGGNIRYIQEFLKATGRGEQVDLSDRVDSSIVNDAMKNPAP